MSASTSDTDLGSGHIGCAAVFGSLPNRQSSLFLADVAHRAGRACPRTLGISLLQVRVPRGCCTASPRADGAELEVPPDFPAPPLAVPPASCTFAAASPSVRDPAPSYAFDGEGRQEAKLLVPACNRVRSVRRIAPTITKGLEISSSEQRPADLAMPSVHPADVKV